MIPTEEIFQIEIQGQLKELASLKQGLTELKALLNTDSRGPV